MIFESFAPSPALHRYVEAFHLRHFKFEQNLVLPFKPFHGQPEQCLSFYINDIETVEYVGEGKKLVRPRSMISGMHTVRINRHTGNDFLILIVNFRPGVLHLLTGIPIFELTNQGIDAESVFSKEIRLVNSRLNSTDNYQEMITIVETFLLERISKLKQDIHFIDEIGRSILKHPEGVSLNRLAAQANLCPRQFERIFRHRIGVGPKLFARLARFHKVYNLKYISPSEDWLSVALACGYHDYQHLVKDCKEFAAATPAQYFLQDTKAPERYFESMKPEKYIII